MSLLNGLARLRHVLTRPTLVSTRPNTEACTAARPRRLKYAIASHAAAASAFSGAGKNQESSRGSERLRSGRHPTLPEWWVRQKLS